MPRRTHRRGYSKKRSGGAATAYPLHYFGAKEPFAADAGRALLPIPIDGMGVRPRIGGKRSRKRKGGFYPSVMGDFTISASRYIVPMALYAGYKMMSHKKVRTRRR
jgi:hypothetical protein|uniref:Uncharacterized protein n=1 Tax=viral metagenome TaxID=1070528 RepID=A0A6C0BGU9_9ZZZZ